MIAFCTHSAYIPVVTGRMCITHVHGYVLAVRCAMLRNNSLSIL